MSDRFLAITLALLLALPLCLSLDGDLFESREAQDAAVPVESLLADPEPAAVEDQLLQDVAREAARRFSARALEAMRQQARELEREARDHKVTWRGDSEAKAGFQPAGR